MVGLTGVGLSRWGWTGCGKAGGWYGLGDGTYDYSGEGREMSHQSVQLSPTRSEGVAVGDVLGNAKLIASRRSVRPDDFVMLRQSP